ncbi:unnamed protein product [Caenorhabditis auriculariae]|uniref:Uncharacterized protein n=1 Tax=Caenorhabditis auriculariae TaxID=2777116 RepID=A0A8S1GVE1_9PELO|nr:unnamed protein product [Caenorhabditis auriculariae]
MNAFRQPPKEALISGKKTLVVKPLAKCKVPQNCASRNRCYRHEENTSQLIDLNPIRPTFDSNFEVQRLTVELNQLRTQRVQYLRSHIRKLSGTQRNPPRNGAIRIGNDVVESVESDHAEDLHPILHNSNDLLILFKQEIEKEKVEAQKDLEKAVAQLEERIKSSTQIEIERCRQEHEEDVRELTLMYTEQYRSMETALVDEKTELMGRIEYLEEELRLVKESRDQGIRRLQEARASISEQTHEFGRAKEQLEVLQNDLSRMNNETRTFEDDARNVEKIKDELEKYKEINAIVMSEFAKMEVERDDLLNSLQKDLDTMGIENRKRFKKLRMINSAFNLFP